MTGVLAYRGGGSPPRQLVWMDRAGNVTGVVGAPDTETLASPELSSDGRRIVVQRIVQGNVDVWLIDASRGVPTRLTFDGREDTLPLFSPDGSRVIFASTRSGIGAVYEKALSGAGEERLLSPTSERKIPLSWSPDGRYLLCAGIGEKTGSDLWALPLDGGTPIAIATTPFEEIAGQFSPDGRWVAYASNESGRMEVYVRPFPEPDGATPVSTSGGTHPRWRPDGKELFYVAPDGRLMAAPIAAAGRTLDPGAPVALFTPRFAIGASITQAKPQYVVGRDGRFLINSAIEQATPPITLVLNWDGEAER